jgi:hypothetical protein
MTERRSQWRNTEMNISMIFKEFFGHWRPVGPIGALIFIVAMATQLISHLIDANNPQTIIILKEIIWGLLILPFVALIILARRK